MISHTNVIRVGGQILWCCHHRELNGPFFSEGLVCPFSDRSDLFHRGDTVICNEHLDFTLSGGILLPAVHLSPHRSNNRVTVMTGHKILHRPRRGCFQMIAPYEMGRQVIPRRVRSCMPFCYRLGEAIERKREPTGFGTRHTSQMIFHAAGAWPVPDCV
jgi:hypothetical protein